MTLTPRKKMRLTHSIARPWSRRSVGRSFYEPLNEGRTIRVNLHEAHLPYEWDRDNLVVFDDVGVWPYRLDVSVKSTPAASG